MKILVVFDDTGKKSEVVADIIGDKGYADVVVKKRKLEEYYQENLRRIFPDLIWKKVSSAFEYPSLLKDLEGYGWKDIRVLHCFSNYLISDEKQAGLSFQKQQFIDEPYGVMNGYRSVAAMFSSVEEYAAFCKNVISGQKAWDLARAIKEQFEIDGLVDISLIGNFIQCVTGNFDSRFFNKLEGNEYTIVKRSSDIRKIKAEYTFYHLLPEDMKYWFIMPFQYEEKDGEASYRMERVHVTDLAIKWVHGSMEEAEFEELMDKYFYFFQKRHEKTCSEEEYQKVADSLYVDKVQSRIAQLKKSPEYPKLDALLVNGTGTNLDALVQKYLLLKGKIEARTFYPRRLVIGHGDPCFSNCLYNKSTKLLKFIDPKGALTEEELWTNPYYDIAKLSHSVCGRYDFFNNALFEVKMNDQFQLELEIPFEPSSYVKIFKKKVEDNGFDYLSVRIYEASLFLSMLPLHLDNPHKVFGFILNAKDILEEIEQNV